MLMLRNRTQRRYQNHMYDAPSYLHLVQMRAIRSDVLQQFHGNL